MPESWDQSSYYHQGWGRGGRGEVDVSPEIFAGHLELADAVSGAVNVRGTFLGGDESSSRHVM